MIRHADFEDSLVGKARLRKLIEEKTLILGGNTRHKIYGRLSCKSGKRMLKKNRVFFHSEKEAIALIYRPCMHCMGSKYKLWKANPDKLLRSSGVYLNY